MSRVVLRGTVHDQGRRIGGTKVRRAVTGTFKAGTKPGMVLVRGIGGIVVESESVWITEGESESTWGIGPYDVGAMLADIDGLEVTLVVADEEVDLNGLIFGDG